MKNRRTINLGFVVVLFVLLYSCASSHIHKGNRFYDAIAYSKAIPHFEKVYSKKPTKEIGAKLADSYYRTGNLEAAEEVYEKVISNDSRKDIQYFNYAKVLMANNKYDKAKVVLEEYLSVHKGDAVAKMLLRSCNTVNDRFIDTSLYELTPIETEGFSNTFSVAEYQDGIVFIADKEVFVGRKKNPWTGNSYLDMYSMEKSEDGTWMNPMVLQGDINGPFHEGPASFSSDGQTVFFTRSNYFKRKMEINEERENNLKIFKATLVEGKWKNLEELPFNSDDYSVGHPALTPCCHTLYFVSDMPGGYGGTDIYRTDLVEGEWTKPENLGPDVNTPGNEMFPYYAEDGALYFSSDAHNSMGGLDVFITYNNGDRWMKPENLNYPINSYKDDFGFIIDEESNTGFVSSSRSDEDKIYEFSRFKPKFNLFGFAHIKGTDTPVEGVTAEITNIETGEIIKAVSDKNGKFKIKLDSDAEYGLMCTKIGCFSRSDEISTKGLKYSQDFYADFEVEEIIINKPIVLENIYYDFDKWNIRPDAAVELDKLVKLLMDNPTIEIEMGSHTDVRGSDRYNQVLSGRRAYAAVRYLVSQGISADRLTWNGYGESVLVNECEDGTYCSEEKHQENRRTEFKVTKM
jgi:outer membrane protein OmpA-like peptidoglycan-associated protein